LGMIVPDQTDGWTPLRFAALFCSYQLFHPPTIIVYSLGWCGWDGMDGMPGRGVIYSVWLGNILVYLLIFTLTDSRPAPRLPPLLRCVFQTRSWLIGTGMRG
jgi:hypothetical protein